MKIQKLKITALSVLLMALFSFGSGALKAEAFSQVDKPSKDSVVRILAIGNSFSDDAIEHYLHGLAKAAGYKVIIGNLYIGGAPLELHWKNASGDSLAYSYRKVDIEGVKKKSPKTSISFALADEKWDYISFQQASPKSGQYDSFLAPLPLLFNYVKERATNPKVKYVWHQTWAYAKDSKHKGFKNYNNDQMQMYEQIADASRKVMKFLPFDMLVPAGTAIQNARTKLGDVLCRDGYHLDVNIGRYVASCIWFEMLFKQTVVGNHFIPEKVALADALVAQTAAHEAAKKPNCVSKIK